MSCPPKLVGAALDDRAQYPPLGVADGAPTFTHALGDAVLGVRHVGPDGVEQFVPRYHATGNYGPESSIDRGTSAAGRRLFCASDLGRYRRSSLMHSQLGFTAPSGRPVLRMPSTINEAGPRLNALLCAGQKSRRSRRTECRWSASISKTPGMRWKAWSRSSSG
jgi:hypothetical protein